MDFERGRSYFMARQHELIREATAKRIQLYSRIVVGNVTRTIVQCARTSGADLIVLGYKGSSTLWEESGDTPPGNLGSIADQVTKYAHCSVLVVR